MSFVDLKNICVSYDGKTNVLEGLNLEIQEGELVSLLGPSGCGKTTTLRVIAGYIETNGGEFLVDGQNYTKIPVHKRNFGIVFQSYALFPHMTVRDNVAFGLKMRKMDKETIRKKVDEMLEICGLTDFADRLPKQMSGGQRQRVALARALVIEPKLLLLDEPLCNLDVQLRIEMRTEMAQIFRELHTTVFHVTHDPSEAFAMADRIVVMNNGLIDQIATPVECYERPASAVVAGLLGAGNHMMAKLESKDGDYGVFAKGSVKIKALHFSGNEACELYFRPEDCTYAKDKMDNAIPVEVVMPTFEGGTYRVIARTEDGEEVTFLHKENLTRGEKGWLSFKCDKLYAYEQSEH